MVRLLSCFTCVGKGPGNKPAGSLVVNSYVNEMAIYGVFILSHCGAIAAVHVTRNITCMST